MATYRCLSHEFSARADRASDDTMLITALAPFRTALDVSPRTTYELKSEGGRYALYVDDQLARISDDPGEPVDLLLWYVGEGVVREERQRLILHAGVVVGRDGRALLLPGPSGSGKSTTTLGLVGAGMDYLSDEFAAIDPASGRVVPFPRPLAIKHGSRLLMPHLDDIAVSIPTNDRTTVHVPVERLGGTAATEDVEPGWVVFPTYVDGATTELTSLTPGQTCMSLLECTFRLSERPHEALRVIADLARRVRGFRLRIGNLSDAVKLLDELTATAASAR